MDSRDARQRDTAAAALAPWLGTGRSAHDAVAALAAAGLLDTSGATGALRELVRLKEGPRDAAYDRDKPLAWARAREVLDGAPVDRDGLYADAVNLAADRSPFGHPLPESEIRAARAAVDAALAAAGPAADVDPAAPVCAWCESLASGTAEHNDGVRYPACSQHGLPGTYAGATQGASDCRTAVLAWIDEAPEGTAGLDLLRQIVADR